jgi:hypothetical protein
MLNSGDSEAEFQGMDGKLFRFKVTAFDEAGLIGEGEHLRAVVLTGSCKVQKSGELERSATNRHAGATNDEVTRHGGWMLVPRAVASSHSSGRSADA